MPPSLSTFRTLIFLFIDENEFLYCFEDYLITILILFSGILKTLRQFRLEYCSRSSILSSIFFTLLSSSVTLLNKLSDIILLKLSLLKIISTAFQTLSLSWDNLLRTVFRFLGNLRNSSSS